MSSMYARAYCHSKFARMTSVIPRNVLGAFLEPIELEQSDIDRGRDKCSPAPVYISDFRVQIFAVSVYDGEDCCFSERVDEQILEWNEVRVPT